MKINILLPYKEKFDKNKASSVSITVKNNLMHTKFLKGIKVYGQYVENALFKDNFVGLNYSIFSLKSKNTFLEIDGMKDCNKIERSLKTFIASEHISIHLSSSPCFALFQGSSFDT